MAARGVSRVYNINDLPDEVLCAIISFLPINEAVHTSLLSRRWRKLFTLMTNLAFELHHDSYTDEQLDWFMNFIDRFVFNRETPSILRFSLRFNHYDIYTQRVDAWLDAVVCHKIQELDISVEGLRLPQSLFSCESLVVLKLDFDCIFFEFEVPERICLPCLKVLHLNTVDLPKTGSVERLLSSCPVLEDFVLLYGRLSSGFTEFNVSNKNLKTLTLEVCEDEDDDDEEGEEGEEEKEEESVVCILINAPSLVHLNYLVLKDHFLVLLDVKSLAKAIIRHCAIFYRGCVPAATRAFRQIQNVQTLEISYEVLWGLRRFGVSIPVFYKMNWLKFLWNFDSKFDPISLEYFLARCVVLETLVFEDDLMYNPKLCVINQHYSLCKSRLAPLLSHLKTIEIQLLDIRHAEIFMAVIAFFLENAIILEKMIISSKQGLAEQEVNIMRKVTSFPRASKKCRVLI